MHIVDLLIVILVILFCYISYLRGAIVQIFSGIFLLLGLLIGGRIGLLFLHPSKSSNFNLIFTTACLIVITAIFVFVGTGIGVNLKHKYLKKKQYKIDRYVGIFVGLIGSLIFIWVGSLLLENVTSLNAQNIILESKIINYVEVNSSIKLTLNHGFYLPTGLDSIEPYAGTTGSQFNTAIAKDAGSVVLIQWEGCNELFSGSGFVSSQDNIVTAAHVVSGAGLVRVRINDLNYVGTVTLYDINNDLAVIHVSGLKLPSLTLNTKPQNINQPVMILGYPKEEVLYYDIGLIKKYTTFNKLNVKLPSNIKINNTSSFYLSNAISQHGQSGGPMILPDGSVIGHLSFYSTDKPHYSYVVSLQNYLAIIKANSNNISATNTGSCSTAH